MSLIESAAWGPNNAQQLSAAVLITRAKKNCKNILSAFLFLLNNQVFSLPPCLCVSIKLLIDNLILDNQTKTSTSSLNIS